MGCEGRKFYHRNVNVSYKSIKVLPPRYRKGYKSEKVFSPVGGTENVGKGVSNHIRYILMATDFLRYRENSVPFGQGERVG